MASGVPFAPLGLRSLLIAESVRHRPVLARDGRRFCGVCGESWDGGRSGVGCDLLRRAVAASAPGPVLDIEVDWVTIARCPAEPVGPDLVIDIEATVELDAGRIRELVAA